MQFTGLKYKNRREIYEGDILEYERRIDTETVRDEVRWHEEKYIVGQYVPTNLKTVVEYGFARVIGNIYENPELITK